LSGQPVGYVFQRGGALAKPGFLTATILGFTHTVGEFGVVLMVGGNIPIKPRRIGANLQSCRGSGIQRSPLVSRRFAVCISFSVLLVLYTVLKTHLLPIN